MKTEYPLKDLTLGQILDQTAARFPDNDAIVYIDRDFRLTYRQFNLLVDEIAKGLMALGIQKGEKVAVWATNIPFWVTLQFATAKIGAILLTVNTNYKTTELEYILNQSETENFFLIDGFQDTDYVNTIYELVPELKTQQRGSLSSERFPFLKRVGFLGQEKHRGMYSIPEIKASGIMITDEDYLLRQKELSPHEVINMQYTSGTTGFPKGVMLTHYNIGNNGSFIGANQKFSENDRLCIPVPLFHCFGCVLGVLAAVNHGTCMVILEKFDPLLVMASVEQEKCTALYGVPTMFITLLEHSLFSKFNFSSLRTGIMAGSNCPIHVMEQVIEKMNMTDVTIIYGQTEASPGITGTRIGDELRLRVETVGRAFPNVEVKVIDIETGKIVPQDVQGEVCCRGYNIMKGYYNNSEATKEAIDIDEWLHTGDLGVMDKQGNLTITGRHKDMIIRGGENIYPREIEEFLYRMDGIKDIQVAAVPSKKYGEEVGAFIVLKEDAGIDESDVKDFCRGKIARYKIPKYVHFLTSYPMTASGKIQKFKLSEMSKQIWPDRP